MTSFLFLFMICYLHGASIPITNSGFEGDNPNAPNNSYWYLDTPPIGWSVYEPSGDIYYPEDTGIINPTGGDAFNDPTYGDSAPEGNCAGYINAGGGLYQTLTGYTLTEDVTYQLTAFVGNPTDNCFDTSTNGNNICTSTNGPVGFPGYDLQLLAGDTVVAEDANTLSIPVAEWRLSTVRFTPSHSHAQLGQTLGVRLLHPNDKTGGEIEWDDIQLNTLTPTTTSSPSFSMQIVSDNGHFIWVGPQTTDFFTADNYCEEQYDTSLASVHSEDENIEISNLCTANAATQVCYIGLNDGGIEGTFVWADGSHLDYLPSSFEPDNAEHGDVYEDCVAVMSGGEWLDTTCNLYHPHSFICNAPTSSPTKEPTNELTVDPTFYPTFDPSDYPTIDPSKTPTESPSQNPTFTPTEKPTEDFGKKHKDCERLKVALTLILQNTTNNENEDTFYYVVKGNPSKMTTIIKRNIDSVSDNDSFADHLNIELIDVANPSLNRVKLNYNITNCNNHIVVDVYLNSSNFTEELTDDINQEYGNIVADITTHIVHILPPPLDLEDLSVSNPVTWALAVAFILLVIFFICSSCHNNVCDVLSCLPWFHAVDESKPGNVLFFVLTVGTFFFQCNNIYVLSYYYVNNMDRSSIILSSAIILSAIVFIQIIIQPLFAACYTFKFTKSEHPTEYEELCNTYWSGRKGAILFLIIISGSFYMTLELLNSRVFGVELFWMGMTETSLKQYGIFQKIGTLLLFMSTVIHMLCSIHFHTIGHDKEISGFFIAALVAHSLSSIHEIGVHCSEPLEHQHYDFVLSVVVDDKEDRKTLEENAGKTKELRRELAMELEVEMDKIQIGKVQRTGTGIKIYAQYICYSVYSSSRLDEIVRHAQIRPKRQRLDETLAKSQMKQFQSNWENCQSDALRLQEIIKKVYQLSTYPKSVKNNTNIANAIELQHTIVHTDYELLHDLK
eukprot:899899_1